MDDVCIGKYDRAGRSFGCNHAIHFDGVRNIEIVQREDWIGGRGIIYIILYGIASM